MHMCTTRFVTGTNVIVYKSRLNEYTFESKTEHSAVRLMLPVSSLFALE